MGMPPAASIRDEIQEKESLTLRDIKRSENQLIVWLTPEKDKKELVD